MRLERKKVIMQNVQILLQSFVVYKRGDKDMDEVIAIIIIIVIILAHSSARTAQNKHSSLQSKHTMSYVFDHLVR